MDTSGIYSEKKIAFYETTYKENILSKPQVINLTVTPAHIHGTAYICEQIGTRENDPEYGRFTCNINDISKVYVNTNNKNNPICIQCEIEDKYVINRRRIILPSFGARNDEIVSMVLSTKEKLIINAVTPQSPEPGNFLEKPLPEKPINTASEATDSKPADNDFDAVTAEIPAYDVFSAVQETGGKGEPDDKPESGAVFTEENGIVKSGYSDSEILNDMLGIDDILSVLEETGITDDDAFFETIDISAVDELVKTMPEEIRQKNPADIEEIVIPQIIAEEITEAAAAAPADEIEVIDAARVIKQKLEEKDRKNNSASQENGNGTQEVSDTGGAYAEIKPAVSEIMNEPVSSVSEIRIIPRTDDKPAVSLTLEEFETAVKKLKIMLDTGTISESEFASEKKKLLLTLY